MPGNFVADSLYLTSERFLIRRTDATIAVSTDEASELQRIFQDDLPSVTIIPNVVDCDDLRARGKAALPDACTTFLNRNANRFVVVMIARNDPVKNYSLALNATLRVLQRGTNTAFAFVGITERDARRLLHTGDFSDRIICIDELENPAPMLRAASAILLTSRKESSPLVVQEARCFGKPVIGTDVPGIRENVRDRHDGVLCSENPEAVAEAILLLATDTSLYDRCANAACRLAEVSSVKAWANQYLDFYTYIHAISRG
jgi:glycosyltransferase involved in cell wall biosynthesis